jgi:hypothetical protein
MPTAKKIKLAMADIKPTNDIESLENDYLVEQISDTLSIQSTSEHDQKLTYNPSTMTSTMTKKKKSFVSRHSLQDLGFSFAELPSRERIPTYSKLLDKIYLSSPKPLIVKSHTKIKVLVVCQSALRVLEIVKDLKTTPNLKVAKLFARHIKVPEQLLQLKNDTYHVGVGTPNRLLKILNDKDAIKKDKIEFVIIDGSHRDQKTMAMVDLDEIRSDLKLLNNLFVGTNAKFYNY